MRIGFSSVEIMPYHEFGLSKYDALQLDYQAPASSAPCDLRSLENFEKVWIECGRARRIETSACSSTNCFNHNQRHPVVSCINVPPFQIDINTASLSFEIVYNLNVAHDN
jgi:hypothetical protein